MKEDVKTTIVFVVILICLSLLFILALDSIITGYYTSAPFHCKDSDGKNFFKAGQVELYTLMKEPTTLGIYYDYCSDENTITEYYCKWENYNYVVKTQQEECDFGCLEGVCIKPRAPKINIIDTIFEFFKLK